MGRKNGMLSMVLGVSILVLIVIIVKVIPQNIRNSQKIPRQNSLRKYLGKRKRKRTRTSSRQSCLPWDMIMTEQLIF